MIKIDKKEWVDRNQQLPRSSCRVLMLGKNVSYQFCHQQILVGHFITHYYDNPIMEFKVTGSNIDWEITHWIQIKEGED